MRGFIERGREEGMIPVVPATMECTDPNVYRRLSLSLSQLTHTIVVTPPIGVLLRCVTAKERRVDLSEELTCL